MSNLIRRQDAIDLIEQFYAFESKSEQIALQIAMRDLPSAQPEPKRGKWIKTARWGRVYYCDQCRNYLDFDGVNAGRGSANFCPNCGADMRERKERTVRAIDADALKEDLTRFYDNEVTARKLIDEQPTIQPEIIRCKDCEHGVLDDGFPHQYFCVFKGDEWNNADYFCGHAKRREVTE